MAADDGKRLGVYAERLRVAGHRAPARPPEARKGGVGARIGARNLEIAGRYGITESGSELAESG